MISVSGNYANAIPNTDINKAYCKGTKLQLPIMMDINDNLNQKGSFSPIKQRHVYSRKREASCSLSEEPKRRDHIRNIANNSLFCNVELLQVESNNQYSSTTSPVINNSTERNNTSDINMNSSCISNVQQHNLHVDNEQHLSSSAITQDEEENVQEMDIDIQHNSKPDIQLSLEDSPSTSTSDLSVHSTGTSVGLQEGLDCLHLSDEIDVPVNDVLRPNVNSTSASPLIHSLFHKVPPTIYFGTSSEKVQRLPKEIRKVLNWKLSTITPAIIRQTVQRSGFKITKDNDDWIGTWGKHLKCANFKNIEDYQKVNHFPGSFHLGRKDKIWLNYRKMQLKHGSEFSFFPETFILPQDIKSLRKVWEEDGPKKRWIIKPPASARGTGIRVINRWCQIPKKRPIIVQRYLSEPYLINGAKFDLRLYVLVPSYDPLRVYIFDDGLARFASVKYSMSVRSLSDNFMHLTNYSINRQSSTYTANEDGSKCNGHKWTLKSFWRYMSNKGIDTQKIWNDILDLVLKTVICAEGPMTRLIKNFSRSRYNCFELFGFDIMLDKELKPWLLEVNISPSLHTASSLDFQVKSQLAKDMLNIVGFQIPHVLISNASQESLLSQYGIHPKELQSWCMNKSLHHWYLSPDEKAKHANYTWKNSQETENILDNLTPDDVRQLVESEDELNRSGCFIRIFPSSSSSDYLQYFEHTRYYNLLLDAWEQKYHDNRGEGISQLQHLCQRNFHLQTIYKGSSSM